MRSDIRDKIKPNMVKRMLATSELVRVTSEAAVAEWIAFWIRMPQEPQVHATDGLTFDRVCMPHGRVRPDILQLVVVTQQ